MSAVTSKELYFYTGLSLTSELNSIKTRPLKVVAKSGFWFINVLYSEPDCPRGEPQT
jgi:hypothetical protein